MLQQPNQTELNHELRATLEARREMGPEYDDALIASFLQKLSQQVAAQRTPPPAPLTHEASPGQRLALAIVSIVMLLGMSIPLVAINSGMFAVACVAVVGINFVYNRPPRRR